MDIASTPLVERIARVLAGHQLSRNADGDMSSASAAVDDLWPDHAEAALAVLKTMREPTMTMERAGDAAVWERMILAALDEESGPGS